MENQNNQEQVKFDPNDIISLNKGAELEKKTMEIIHKDIFSGEAVDYEKDPKKKFHLMLLIIALVLSVVVGGVYWYFFFRI